MSLRIRSGMIAVALSSAWKPLCASSVSKPFAGERERIEVPGFRIVLNDEDERRLASAGR